MSHRFRLLSACSPDEFSLHVVSCKIDAVQKQLQIKVRQPLDGGEVMRYIQTLCESFQQLSFEILDSNDDATSSITYKAKAIKHSIDYDYAISDCATHILTLKYK